MSGFCGSNDSVDSPPVENMCGCKDSGESIKIPPGYRFRPTDEELITHYLWRKIGNPSFCTTAIAEADLNRLEPWDFPGVSVGEREWFFFSERNRKYATGQSRTNRATYSGYWKAAGKDTEIFKGKTLVGTKKTLLFYKGKAPKVAKTDWVMHEYRLEGDNSLQNLPQNAKNEWVICKVFLKSTVEKKTYISWIGAGNCSEELKLLMMHIYTLIMSTLKLEDNEYVGRVRQQQIDLPKLQQSNLGAENAAAAAASSSMNAHNNTTMEDNSRVCVKVGYNNDTVMFMLPFATMDSLKTEILKRYNLEAETFKIRYRDEDEEMVTIACDEDLHYCLEFFKSIGTTPVRLSLLKE